MAEYHEPPDRGINRNDGVPEANGFSSSNHSSPHNSHAQIRPHDTGNVSIGTVPRSFFHVTCIRLV